MRLSVMSPAMGGKVGALLGPAQTADRFPAALAWWIFANIAGIAQVSSSHSPSFFAAPQACRVVVQELLLCALSACCSLNPGESWRASR
jgi:hypothetical protein